MSPTLALEVEIQPIGTHLANFEMARPPQNLELIEKLFPEISELIGTSATSNVKRWFQSGRISALAHREMRANEDAARTTSKYEKFALFCNAILNKEDPDTSWFAYTAYDDPFAEHLGTEPPPPIFIYE